MIVLGLAGGPDGGRYEAMWDGRAGWRHRVAVSIAAMTLYTDRCGVQNGSERDVVVWGLAGAMLAFL